MKENKNKQAKKEEKEQVYASMMSDYGFKVTFGNENNTLFLRKAIQLLIKSKTIIRQVWFIRNEASGVTKASKSGVYDIACEDEKGRVFIVEMQMVDFKNFIERSKFYGFHVFNKMVKKGKYSFADLKDVYVISFLAGKVFNTREFHHICNLRNQKGQIIDKQLTFVYLELGKWHKEIHQIKNDLDKIIYIMKMTEAIKNNESYQLPHFLSEEWIETAMKELELGNMTPDERMAYEMEMARIGSIIGAFNEQKKKIEEKRKVIKDIEKVIEDKEKVIEDKEKVIEDKEKVIEDKEKVIEDKEKVIEDKEKVILAKDKLLEEQEKLNKEKLEQEKQLAQKQEKVLITKQLILVKTMSLEQIASVVDLPLEEVQQINEQLKNKNEIQH